MATSTSSLDLFCDKIRFLQPSVLVVKDYKPMLLVFLQPIFFQWLLDLVVSSKRVVFVVFKALYGDGVYRCSFPFLHFRCVFQAPVDDEQLDEEDDQFIFFMSSYVKLSFYCTTNCFS